MKTKSIPIATQPKYQFFTKANDPFSKHRIPPVRYFSLCYLPISYSVTCRTLICRICLRRRLLVILTSQSKFKKMLCNYSSLIYGGVLYLCNLQNTHLQNILKMSTLSNLKMR